MDIMIGFFCPFHYVVINFFLPHLLFSVHAYGHMY